MKYPIGTQTFSTLIEDGFVYIDKTDLVYELSQKRVCFLCRPRRFGKSLLISTLESYFKGEKSLFEGLKIASLEKEWKSFPVFHIDFSMGCYEKPEGLQEVLENHLGKWEKQYGVENHVSQFGIRFSNIISAVRQQTGKKVVVLVDEYDKPLLDVLMTPQEETNRNILKDFYGVFKYSYPDLRFVFLTGVTKFSQVSIFSGFNQVKDISMDSRFDALCGITGRELQDYFDEELEKLASKYACTKETLYEMFKKRYDGYHFSEQMLGVYNPFSVLNALDSMRLDDFWFSTGTPTYLVKLLHRSQTDMQKILSRAYAKKYFVDYKADKEEPLPMLYQSGYVTIKGFDMKRNEFTLDYPNDEVRNGFVDILANDYLNLHGETNTLAMDIGEMLGGCRLDDLRNSLTAFFASIPYVANKDERAASFESHFQYTFYLVFRLLSCYVTLMEKQNSHGRADVIVETEKYIYIFEFKLDGSVQDALEQIDNQGYAEPYLNDSRKLIKVGVNFSSAKRTIVDWKNVGPLE